MTVVINSHTHIPWEKNVMNGEPDTVERSLVEDTRRKCEDYLLGQRDREITGTRQDCQRSG